ncbi:MAG: glycine dehydrogenase (aminomethyl-transferring), partial [Bauldia litoralis]
MTAVSSTERPTLAALEQTGAFIGRHIGPSEDELAAMLDAVGAGSLEALVDSAAPDSIRFDGPLDLPPPQTERETARRLAAIAARNRQATSMIGMGYYGTVTPAVIRRNVFENPGWYTAYTPYQPEISQGRLEALLIFQTMVQ